jgi:methyl-accepting chemotaxis protein
VLILIIFLVVISGFSLLQLRNIGAEISGVAKQYMPLTRQITTIRVHQLEQAKWLERGMRFALTGHMEKIEDVENNYNALHEKILRTIEESKAIAEQAVQTAVREETREKFTSLLADIETLEEDYHSYEKHIPMTLSDLKAGKLATIDDHMGMITPIENKISDEINTMLIDIETFTQNSVEAVRAQEQDIILLLMILSAAALVVGIVLGIILIRSVVRQIGGEPYEVMKIAEAIADGDLTRNVHTARRRETGIAASMNQMQQGLREIITTIQHSVEQTEEKNQNLSTSAEQTASSINQITTTITSIEEQIKKLSSSVEDATSAVNRIGNNVDNLNDQISNQVSAVSQTSASIEEISASINSIAKTADEKMESTKKLMQSLSDGKEKMNETTDQIEDISGRASEMMEMIDVINNISSQTDLLSMNAAIEAAHAGEHGRGFAVVAEEIRNLAISTAENATTITNNLQQIIDTIKTLGETSEDTLEFYGSIEENATETINAFTEISYTMGELSGGTEEINNAMATLSETSDQVQSGSAEMKNGIDVISNTTETVQNVSQEVLNAIQEISAGSQQINEAMTELKDSVHVISREIERIVTEVSTFKL